MLKKHILITALTLSFNGSITAFPVIIGIKLYEYIKKEYNLSKIPEYDQWELEIKLDNISQSAYRTGNRLAISLAKNAIHYHYPYADEHEHEPLSSDMHTCLNTHPLIVGEPWLKEKKFVDAMHVITEKNGSISDVQRIVQSNIKDFHDYPYIRESVMHTLITVFGDCQKAAARR